MTPLPGVPRTGVPPHSSRIGQVLGGRDHSTVAYALGAIERRKDRDHTLRNAIAAVRARCMPLARYYHLRLEDGPARVVAARIVGSIRDRALP
jgi:hypothetical protein